MSRFAPLVAPVLAPALAPALALAMGSAAMAQGRAADTLLPTPAKVVAAGSGFALASGTPVVAGDAGARNAAARLAEFVALDGVRLATPVAATRAPVAIRFVRTAGIAAEGYRLSVDATGATIAAADDAGLLYGAVTLWQLASADPAHRVEGVRIDDAPRFGWRGLMLDSARHFRPAAFVRRLLDAMAASKLNRLHWHLVDDQGWRLPVSGWPRLTSVSAWRRPATAPGAPPLPETGGFYTEAEIRGIVAYAAARGITVVPEIEMPGHALAAIRAYPALGMGVPIPRGTESYWGVFPWLYDPGEKTFAFLEDVLTQVMRLFPSPWIHVGGDEAVKDQWRASPAVQARIKRLGLKDEEALQGWFMARIARFLAAHGRRPVGWDELLEGGVPADTTITSWRGIDGAVKAAKGGHDTILSPAPTLYLNNRQGSGPEEPPSHGALVTLDAVLGFDPLPAALSPAEQRHVLGLQGNLFTEHVRTDERAAWLMFPRALAIAETGWAGFAPRDAAGMAPRLVPQIDRLRAIGIGAADSAWAVTARLDRRRDGEIGATLSTQAALPVRYTLDGAAPTASSERYVEPLTLAAGQRLRAAAFLGDRVLPGGYDATLSVAAALTRTSRELTPCRDGALLDLEDDAPAAGPRAHFLINITDPCWRWNDAPLPGASRIAISVGQLPFNFQIGADRAKIRFHPPATPAGEVEVRAGGCDGPPIATLPLAPATRSPGVTRLAAALPPQPARADLCVTYTARGPDPLWAVERIELLP